MPYTAALDVTDLLAPARANWVYGRRPPACASPPVRRWGARMHDLLLGSHIAIAVVGLLLGPFALPGMRAGLTWLLTCYLAVVLAIAITGTILAVPAGLPAVALLGIATGIAAVITFLLPADRPGSAARWRLRLGWGTYVALLTATLVVSTSHPLIWLIPTLIGIPVIEYVIVPMPFRPIRMPRRPSRRPRAP